VATKKGDVYVFCRDNFSGVKASLHRSGRWRFGFTSEAIANYRGAVVGEGSDRVWSRWSRSASYGDIPIVTFRILIPIHALYLAPEQRRTWKPTVFVEPPTDSLHLSVISVCAIPRGQDFNFAGAEGGRIAVLDLDGGMDIHVVVTYVKDNTWQLLAPVREHIRKSAKLFNVVSKNPNSVILAHGTSGDGVTFLLPYPVKSLVL